MRMHLYNFNYNNHPLYIIIDYKKIKDLLCICIVKIFGDSSTHTKL
jgi:hypothetical protein